MKNILEILAGPASFAFTAFALTGAFTPAQSFAIGTAVWMALWWILRPVSIYVTAFIPILVDSFFDLIPEGHVLSQYFSEIAVLLLGSDLICLTWTTTGLDRRISVKTLCCIGTSMKNQIFVWFLASTLLSVFLPNVVVAAIFCPIAVAMLHFVGERTSQRAVSPFPSFLPSAGEAASAASAHRSVHLPISSLSPTSSSSRSANSCTMTGSSAFSRCLRSFSS